MRNSPTSTRIPWEFIEGHNCPDCDKPFTKGKAFFGGKRGIWGWRSVDVCTRCAKVF